MKRQRRHVARRRLRQARVQQAVKLHVRRTLPILLDAMANLTEDDFEDLQRAEAELARSK